MANILFSVCGVGVGHAARSTPLIEALQRRHRVLVMSYGPAHAFLSKRFSGVKKLSGFSLFFENDALSKRKTLLYNLKNLPVMFWNNYNEMRAQARAFDPDFIVNDFEVNALYLGKLWGKQVATISNMHLIEYIHPPMGVGEKLAYYLTEKPILKAFTGSDYYLIPALCKPAERKGNTFFFHPLVRQEVLKQKPRDEGFSLVYMRRQDLSTLTRLLRQAGQRDIVVYATDPSARHRARLVDGVSLRPFSEEAFARDLARCSHVFTHGGSTVLSEALVLGKPSFTFTEQNFFERYYNGFLVASQGFGVVHDRLTRADVAAFLRQVPAMQARLQKNPVSAGNHAMQEALEKLVRRAT